MPEASVYKDYCIVSRENQIWTTGITAVTHSETESSSVQCGTDFLFDGSIFSADVRHYCMALFICDGVHFSTYTAFISKGCQHRLRTMQLLRKMIYCFFCVCHYESFIKFSVYLWKILIFSYHSFCLFFFTSDLIFFSFSFRSLLALVGLVGLRLFGMTSA